jgi:hypothetical protein
MGFRERAVRATLDQLRAQPAAHQSDAKHLLRAALTLLTEPRAATH